MAQYPPEKDAHANWVYPGSQGTPAQSTSYPPPQGYPQGPPPDYGYHPGGGPTSQQTSFHPPPGPPGPYNTPHADPSPQDGGMSLGAFYGSKGAPPMWQRQAPPHYPYNAFPPMCLISNGHELSKGFPEVPPPCQLNPHPFATHDVGEADWTQFLADVKKAGSLSGAQRIKSNVIPMVTGMGFFTGFIATMAIEKKMKYKNRGAAGDVVDHWNHYFFGPRRMEVVLCQASQRLSGRVGAAPVGDPRQAHMADGLRRRGDSSDSSSDEDRHGEGGSDRQRRRAARRERRESRREAKQERRAWKERGDDKEPYQLYITAV